MKDNLLRLKNSLPPLNETHPASWEPVTLLAANLRLSSPAAQSPPRSKTISSHAKGPVGSHCACLTTGCRSCTPQYCSNGTIPGARRLLRCRTRSAHMSIAQDCLCGSRTTSTGPSSHRSRMRRRRRRRRLGVSACSLLRRSSRLRSIRLSLYSSSPGGTREEYTAPTPTESCKASCSNDRGGGHVPAGPRSEIARTTSDGGLSVGEAYVSLAYSSSSFPNT
jgi:hypothetical protein